MEHLNSTKRLCAKVNGIQAHEPRDHELASPIPSSVANDIRQRDYLLQLPQRNDLLETATKTLFTKVAILPKVILAKKDQKILQL